MDVDTMWQQSSYILYSFSALYFALDDMGKGMIRWYIITRIHKTLPCIHINRCWIVCGENSNATFTLHHYRQYQQLQQQNQVEWCFLQLPDTFTHTKQRLSTTPCHINQLLYTLYMFIFQYKCMYILNKFHPLFLLLPSNFYTL